MPIYSDLPYIGPPRWYGDYRTTKRLVVVHCTANTASAEGEAGYAKRREERVSSHYYVDDDSLVQSLNTDKVAYHAGNTEGNTRGISYEFTGLTSWSRSTWLADSDDIHLAARQMARDCRHWGIPARWLTVDQLRAGWAGLTTHDDVRRAWGGTHVDPGPGFPRDVLLASVQRALTGEDEMELTDTVRLRTEYTDVKYSSATATVEGVLTSTNYYVLSTRNRMLSEFAAINAALDELAARSGVTPEQLEAIKQAARDGAAAGTPEGFADAVADELADRLDGADPAA